MHNYVWDYLDLRLIMQSLCLYAGFCHINIACLSLVRCSLPLLYSLKQDQGAYGRYVAIYAVDRINITFCWDVSSDGE